MTHDDFQQELLLCFIFGDSGVVAFHQSNAALCRVIHCLNGSLLGALKSFIVFPVVRVLCDEVRDSASRNQP